MIDGKAFTFRRFPVAMNHLPHSFHRILQEMQCLRRYRQKAGSHHQGSINCLCRVDVLRFWRLALHLQHSFRREETARLLLR